MQCFYAVGKRKRAISRVQISPGTGKRIVNDLPMKEYFNREFLNYVIDQPLNLLELKEKFDIKAKVTGGGKSAQAEAIRLGISRALLDYDESLRSQLKKEGFLTRDARIVERKKTGQPKARKKSQFSKR